ncbi:hypothetical protein PQR63_18145 [Herbaspirillum rhizosphaerae]|uniref:Uncharacterized protein n=1 Tax=Herbaspirillum rhizosphaerae TaxID=346179 RepID=A0ABW8ZCR0_9BURK
MKIYLSRVLWYVAVILILLGVMLLPSYSILGPLMTVIGAYIPMSIIWTPVAHFMHRHYGFREKFLGMDLNTVCVCILFFGIICCASFPYLKNSNVLEIGIFMTFLGSEGIISLREGKLISFAKKTH